ncbi:hypothetical protein RF11_01893 [Thelohanellus kitauei]|uniref:Uncharacterized protein n=1 Tax=Thelohanellus kitauei TaxID=669202 RepID=A0A0C2NI58_THEKT|nr:hypothetical protein RF11_01891 [Thelohanellus kitauei]KII73687.1 hypothetical protein RF11_01893 [Thelohanellus kitauei]
MDGSTLLELATTYKENVILNVMINNKLSLNDYFEVYCSFNEIVGVAYMVLKLAKVFILLNQDSYEDLQPLVKNRPKTDSDISEIKVQVIQTKNKLLTDILEKYDSVKFVYKPSLSPFIDKVCLELDNENCKIRDGIRNEIEKVLDDTQTFENDQDTNQKGIVFY